jgi:ADP-ribosylglycohydrolase
MIGAIIGDIIGSPYEGSMLNWVDNREFPLFANEFARFTDDTILTCGTADAILNSQSAMPDFSSKYREWNLKYPGRGYGSGFQEWVDNGGTGINKSYANGCMMRCSPIPLYYKSPDEVYNAALESIKMTHHSSESERGILSITFAIHMALGGASKLQIKSFVEEECGHMLDMSVDQWRDHPKPNIRCNLSAPQALVCFLESDSYESTIRNAVYTKGDTDTISAIAGSIAEAFYGVQSIPQEMIDGMKARISPEMADVVNKFYEVIGKYRSQYEGFHI